LFEIPHHNIEPIDRMGLKIG